MTWLETESGAIINLEMIEAIYIDEIELDNGWDYVIYADKGPVHYAIAYFGWDERTTQAECLVAAQSMIDKIKVKLPMIPFKSLVE